MDEDFEEDEGEASPLTGPRLVTAVVTLVLCGLIVHNALTGQAERQPPAQRAAEPLENVEAPAKPRAGTRLATRVRVEVPREERATAATILDIQTSLRALGHYHGDIDGIAAPALADAIRAAERSLGLDETGKPSPAIADRLRLAREIAAITGTSERPAEPSAEQTALSANPDIGAVQRALARLGYQPGPADGSLGPRTREAIRLFERDRRLSETGDITPALLSELTKLGAGG